MNYPLLARNIRIHRRMMELTQEEFASLLGTTVVRVGQIERGTQPAAEEMAAICKVLKVTEEELNQEDKKPLILGANPLQNPPAWHIIMRNVHADGDGKAARLQRAGDW